MIDVPIIIFIATKIKQISFMDRILQDRDT